MACTEMRLRYVERQYMNKQTVILGYTNTQDNITSGSRSKAYIKYTRLVLLLLHVLSRGCFRHQDSSIDVVAVNNVTGLRVS